MIGADSFIMITHQHSRMAKTARLVAHVGYDVINNPKR